MRRFAFAGMIMLTAGCAAVAPTPESGPVTPDVAVDTVLADARAAYLAALKQIDSGFVVNADRAIRRAENICLDVEQDKDESIVINNAVQRLSGGDASINAAQAAQAVELAKTHICPQ